MRKFLDRFILGFPVLFLKQYPYAWIAAMAVWPHSPSVAGLFLLIVLIGILSLEWQSAAWISQMRSRYAMDGGKFYVDRPPIPWRMAARNVGLLIVGGALLAFLLQGRLGLSFWQFFFMIVGFMIFYQDTRFFGPAVTYIITAAGLGIRFVPGHIDYRLFLQFREISRIERGIYREGPDVDLFARTGGIQDGLLLIPKDPKGFSKRIGRLFIVPNEAEKFMEQLPYGYGNLLEP